MIQLNSQNYKKKHCYMQIQFKKWILVKKLIYRFHHFLLLQPINNVLGWLLILKNLKKIKMKMFLILISMLKWKKMSLSKYNKKMKEMIEMIEIKKNQVFQNLIWIILINELNLNDVYNCLMIAPKNQEMLDFKVKILKKDWINLGNCFIIFLQL